ncbi:PFL family protein [Veillonella sp. R32]|uniref:PFL family protein n=1 Tax=Veillonella sp. R32 TaxID=2021312 RepID=UPI0013896CBF|nr:PFL family protein [Veillonella sp. R32]KAF1683371.1 PFL family protein [Veillonella sp. R32]
MLSIENIIETNQMIRDNKLDVRTITMGISLLGCAASDGKTLCTRIYDHITKEAEHLVATGEAIAQEYGVPIINKRVAVTPISLVAAGSDLKSYVPVAEALDKAAKAVGVNFIGGFSALVSKGYTEGDHRLIASIPEALATTDLVCSSVGIGSTKAGINMDAVAEMGRIVKQTAELTADRDAFGCAKLVIFCNPVEDNPFMAGAFHGVTEGNTTISVGVSGPGVVKHALEAVRGRPFDEVAETIKRTAFKITRVGQLVAQEASRRLGKQFGIIDLSLAPTPAVGDSVAHVLEEMGITSCGAHGTTAALALLNDAVKKGGLMASSHVGGLSGAFIPVSEDKGMIDAVSVGSLSLDKLEAMTCVCSVGLDMIAVPGDTSAATISAIIADEAAIGMINNKTTAVRLIPVPGKTVGDMVEFGGLLGYCPIIEVSPFGAEEFIQRGGRIPAPIRSLTN